MVSTLLVSLTASVTYCRVHQRAWAASLDQWLAFCVPTRYGSHVTDAMCDLCTASRKVAEYGAGRRAWSTSLNFSEFVDG